MLSAAHRMRSSREFATTIARGRRAGRPTLVVHFALPEPVSGPSRVGFVVSRAVGDSVTRHRVTRQLRHLLRDRVEGLPVGSHVVVRALPASAAAGSEALGEDLDRALSRLRANPGTAA